MSCEYKKRALLMIGGGSTDAGLYALLGDAMKAGIRLYAWWKDGTQWVGSGAWSLKTVEAEIDEAVRQIQLGCKKRGTR